MGVVTLTTCVRPLGTDGPWVPITLESAEKLLSGQFPALRLAVIPVEAVPILRAIGGAYEIVVTPTQMGRSAA